MSKGAADINEKKFVIFRLGKNLFGLNILQVREIMQFREITRLPQTPDYVEGIINIRGEVVPVIDLHKRFVVETEKELKECKIITVKVEGELTGLIVDDVEEVLTIEDKNLVSLTGEIGDDKISHVEKVALLDDRIIIMININELLSDMEKIELSEVTRAVEEVEIG